MEMNISENSKTVEIWLSRAEKSDPTLRTNLHDLYAEWKKKGFLVAVYESGEKDLYQGTLDLLAYNKKRIAELEVRRAREAKYETPSFPENLYSCSPNSKPHRHADRER